MSKIQNETKTIEAVQAPKVENETTASTTTTKVARDYKETATQKELITKYGNKSKAIRALKKDGKTTSEIADLLNIRYQHVRNVLNQVIKTEPKTA